MIDENFKLTTDNDATIVTLPDVSQAWQCLAVDSSASHGNVIVGFNSSWQTTSQQANTILFTDIEEPNLSEILYSYFSNYSAWPSAPSTHTHKLFNILSAFMSHQTDKKLITYNKVRKFIKENNINELNDFTDEILIVLKMRLG